MNKCIRQNWKIWNHVRFRPLGKVECPSEEKEQCLWADKLWNHIVNDDLTRHVIYNRKGLGTDKNTLTIWDDGQYVYLVHVLRTKDNIDMTDVYVKELTEDNVNDFKAIAKFLHRDVNKIIGGSLKDVQKFNELVNKQEMLKADA